MTYLFLFIHRDKERQTGKHQENENSPGLIPKVTGVGGVGDPVGSEELFRLGDRNLAFGV